MEIVILDRHSLQVKDYFFIDRDYYVVTDKVISSKSTFSIQTEKINARVSDLLVIRNSFINYIGVLETIQKLDEYNFKLLSMGFSSLFNIDILPENFTGSVGDYIKNLIDSNYINCVDYYQSIPYLSVTNNSSSYDDIVLDNSKQMKLNSIIEYLSKIYSLTIMPKLKYIRGRVSEIELIITDIERQLKIKNNKGLILDLVINKNSTQSINKVVFVPSMENEQYSDSIEFYLLKDNSITTSSNHELRYEIVMSKTIVYKDDEYSTLDVIANNELNQSIYDHNISFKMKMTNEMIVPTIDFNVGDYIQFIDGNEVYETLVTRIAFNNTEELVEVVLGEYRHKLTDKINLLSKKIEYGSTTTSYTSGRIENIDGGEF